MSFARLLFLRLCDFATWKMKKNNEKKRRLSPPWIR
tara:strand:+ start:124 stop:231 length:108 start_codon:yes stop_codon:yes gene_type:complete